MFFEKHKNKSSRSQSLDSKQIFHFQQTNLRGRNVKRFVFFLTSLELFRNLNRNSFKLNSDSICVILNFTQKKKSFHLLIHINLQPPLDIPNKVSATKGMKTFRYHRLKLMTIFQKNHLFALISF